MPYPVWLFFVRAPEVVSILSTLNPTPMGAWNLRDLDCDITGVRLEAIGTTGRVRSGLGFRA